MAKALGSQAKEIPGMSPTFLANRKRRGQGSGQPWSRGRTGGFPERGEPECGAQTVVLILPSAGEQHLPRDDRRRESGAEMQRAAQEAAWSVESDQVPAC